MKSPDMPSNPKPYRGTFLAKYFRFARSLYSRVVLMMAILALFLFFSYNFIFRSVNDRYIDSIIHYKSANISSIVNAALYHSMLRNDYEELFNTLDIINDLSEMDELNLYNSSDSLVYSAYSPRARHLNNPNCLLCHTSMNELFHGEGKAFRIVSAETNCSMFVETDNSRHLLIRNPILNERSCYTNKCHAHSPDEVVLGSMIINMPLKEFDSSVEASSNKYLLLAVLATIMFTSLLLMFTRRNIQKPLNELVMASQSITQGNRKVRMQIKPGQLEDMRTVSTAFNEMLDKLQAANHELENWSRQLEYKVQKKSEELSSVQNELIQIERIASLGKLSASVAHELNNPLSGILVYAKLIHKQLTAPELTEAKKESALKQLKLIESETKRCGDIVKGLLDFSRKDQADFEHSHVHDILRETYDLLHHQMKIKNIGFLTDFKAQMDMIQCSPNQIKQACVAMLVNSSEAVNENGEVILRTLNKDAHTITIEISDNGKGIAEENLSHIFEPFFSTKHEASGIGLGLAIVHGIVQSHKGSIEVLSTPGNGTTMSITIPLSKNKNL
jgi:two-component system, NtrC family, sensor kinase